MFCILLVDHQVWKRRRRRRVWASLVKLDGDVGNFLVYLEELRQPADNCFWNYSFHTFQQLSWMVWFVIYILIDIDIDIIIYHLGSDSPRAELWCNTICPPGTSCRSGRTGRRWSRATPAVTQADTFRVQSKGFSPEMQNKSKREDQAPQIQNVQIQYKSQINMKIKLFVVIYTETCRETECRSSLICVSWTVMKLRTVMKYSG